MIEQENSEDARLAEVEANQDSFAGSVSSQNVPNMEPVADFPHPSSAEHFQYQQVHQVFPTIADEYGYEALVPGEEDKLRAGSISPVPGLAVGAPGQVGQQGDAASAAYLTALYGGHPHAQHYYHLQDMGMVAGHPMLHQQPPGAHGHAHGHTQGHPGTPPPPMQHATHLGGAHQPWNLGQHHTQGPMHSEGDHHKVDARMNPDAVMAAQLQMEAALRILSMTGAPPGNQPMDAAAVHSAQGGYVAGQQDTYGLGSHSHQHSPGSFDPHLHAVEMHHQHNPYAPQPSHQTSYTSGGRGGGSQSGQGYGSSGSGGYFDGTGSSGGQGDYGGVGGSSAAYGGGFGGSGSGSGGGSGGRGKGRGFGGRGRGRGRGGSPLGPVGYKAPAMEPLSLEGLNPPAKDFRYDPPQSARFFVIKSYSEDDVHKSIKYGLWTSTETGNRRLNTAFKEILITAGVSGIRLSEAPPTEDKEGGKKEMPNAQASEEGMAPNAAEEAAADGTKDASEKDKGNKEANADGDDADNESNKDNKKAKDSGDRAPKEWTLDQEPPAPIYLFFSVNASGQFCGMAQMMSPVNFEKQFTAWAQSKWKGQFKVKWIFVKDIPNSNLRHIILANNENKPVTNSRDTQEIPFHQGCEMVRIFGEYQARTSLLDDFAYYDKRQAAMEGGHTPHLGDSVVEPSPSSAPGALGGGSGSGSGGYLTGGGKGGSGRGSPNPGRRKRFTQREEDILPTSVAEAPFDEVIETSTTATEENRETQQVEDSASTS